MVCVLLRQRPLNNVPTGNTLSTLCYKLDLPHKPTLIIIIIDTHLLIYHIVKVHTSLPCGNVATRHNLVIVLTISVY